MIEVSSKLKSLQIKIGETRMQLANDVLLRTYSRIKEDGTLENWDDISKRVARGNAQLVRKRLVQLQQHYKGYNDEIAFSRAIRQKKLIPAGRQLYSLGAQADPMISNCFIVGWRDGLRQHCATTFNCLMLGGGVTDCAIIQ